jgi:hypothetical protein
MQERKAIREQRELDPDAWSLPVSEISAQRVRHREADGYLASRPPMCLLGKLMSLWEEVESVTGQRSNQLNVPTRQINEMRNNQCLCGIAPFA